VQVSQCKRGACDIAIRLPRKRVDDLKAVQAASRGNTEDGVHYHCRVQFAHSLTWQHVPSKGNPGNSGHDRFHSIRHCHPRCREAAVL